MVVSRIYPTTHLGFRKMTVERQQQRLTQGRPAATTAQELYARSREAWMEAHPPGCLEYREAMSPRGVYGKWLREKSIAAQVGDSLFMHAGINPARPAPKSIAEVNDRARAEIRRIDAHRQRLVAKRLALPSFTLQQLLAASAAELQVATDSLAASKHPRSSNSLEHARRYCSGETVGVTVTIGVANWAGDSVDELVGRADGALYAGKATGRDTVVFAAPPAPAAARRSSDPAPPSRA